MYLFFSCIACKKRKQKQLVYYATLTIFTTISVKVIVDEGVSNSKTRYILEISTNIHYVRNRCNACEKIFRPLSIKEIIYTCYFASPRSKRFNLSTFHDITYDTPVLLNRIS